MQPSIIMTLPECTDIFSTRLSSQLPLNMARHKVSGPGLNIEHLFTMYHECSSPIPNRIFFPISNFMSTIFTTCIPISTLVLQAPHHLPLSCTHNILGLLLSTFPNLSRSCCKATPVLLNHITEKVTAMPPLISPGLPVSNLSDTQTNTEKTT